MSKNCVCEVCTCSQHHCPKHTDTPNSVNIGSNAPMNGQSVSRTSFDFTPTERVQPVLPKPALQKSTDPIRTNTTANDTYNWKTAEPSPKRQPAAYVPSKLPLDGKTTSQETFTGMTGERTMPIRPAERPRDSLPTDYGTTNKAAFTGAPTERTTRILPTQSIQKSDAPIDATTSYSSQYAPGQPTERASPIKQTSRLSLGGNEPVKYTTSNDVFSGQPIERAVPIVPTPKPLLAGEFEGTTTNKAAFTPVQPQERVSPIKPAERPKNLGKLDDLTSHKQDYPGWDPEARPQRPQQTYQPNPIPFDGKTMNASQYAAPAATERVSPVKPNNNNAILNPGQPEFGTTYNDHMHAWQPTREAPIVKADNLKPSGAFQGSTEQRENFQTNMGVTRTSPIKPTGNLTVAKGTIDDNTTTKSAYPAPPLPCPATRLPPSQVSVIPCSQCDHPHQHGIAPSSLETLATQRAQERSLRRQSSATAVA